MLTTTIARTPLNACASLPGEVTSAIETSLAGFERRCDDADCCSLRMSRRKG